MATSSTEPEAAKLFGLHFSPELARNLELIRKHPRETLRKLLERHDDPAMRDTLL
jgi:hypothetical protein